MHNCAACGGRFDYPTDIKMYGEHYLCRQCLKTQTPCDTCGRKRYAKKKTNKGEMCTGCINNVIRNHYHVGFTCCNCDLYILEVKVKNADVAQYPDLKKGKWCKDCFEKAIEGLTPVHLKSCVMCGNKTQERTIDGKKFHVCNRCVDEYKPRVCGICHEHLEWRRTKATSHEGKKVNVCGHCIEHDIVFLCVECGLYHMKEDMVKARVGWSCQKCIKKYGHCQHCRQLALLSTTADGFKLCATCRDQRGICIDGCKKIAFNLRHTKQGTLCEDCRHEMGAGVCENWRYRPGVFIEHGDGELFFGIENEISLGENTGKKKYENHIAKKFHTTLAYTQHDGTIDYGVEVVFHPMTFEYAKTKAKLGDMFTKAVRSSPTTGMHVHITRTAFNKMHLYKFMRFISTNPAFVEVMAQRQAGGRRQYRITDGELLASKARGEYVDQDKYTDINVNHTETIELRIFKGAVTIEQLYANLEFCHALFMFTRDCHPRELESQALLRYVEQHIEIYSNLHQFLVLNGGKISADGALSIRKGQPKKMKLNRGMDGPATIPWHTAAEINGNTATQVILDDEF